MLILRYINEKAETINISFLQATATLNVPELNKNGKVEAICYTQDIEKKQVAEIMAAFGIKKALKVEVEGSGIGKDAFDEGEKLVEYGTFKSKAGVPFATLAANLRTALDAFNEAVEQKKGHGAQVYIRTGNKRAAKPENVA
jgi:hypothetical protein